MSCLWDADIPLTIPSTYNVSTHLMAKLTYFNVRLATLAQAPRVPGGWGSQISSQSAHESGCQPYAQAGRLYPWGNIPGTDFCQRLSRTQGHSAARRIKSMKNSSESTVNRTRDLPAYSAKPQPSAPPRAPSFCMKAINSCASQTEVSSLRNTKE
jgi:hypothetical protein